MGDILRVHCILKLQFLGVFLKTQLFILSIHTWTMLSGTLVAHRTLRPRQGEWETLMWSGVEQRGKGVSESTQFRHLSVKEDVAL